MREHVKNAAILLLSVGVAALILWFSDNGQNTVYRVPCSSNTGFCLEYR